MSRKPKIIVSSLDLERLEALLDDLGDKTFPGCELLHAELNRAEVREPKDMPAKTVTMNSTVTFKMLPDGNVFDMTLVYPKDINGDEGRLSIFTPIGSAILGLSVGQKINWQLAGKEVQVEIIKVSYQPERDGVFYR